LFHYLPELEAYQMGLKVESGQDLAGSNHLNVLVDYLRITYAGTAGHLASLFENHEITYDLLWALFKPNAHVYTTCPGTGKPRCVRYDFGQEKMNDQGLKYFELEYRYLDFDGKVFGEVTESLQIDKFRGVRRINTLNAFPLEYHPAREDMKKHLIACGRKFATSMDSHHCQYQGIAFFEQNRHLAQVPVDGRIMIDANLFRKINPNYPRFRNKKPICTDFEFDVGLLIGSSADQSHSSKVRSNGKEPSEMSEDELLTCCPTLLGFSLSHKFWGKSSQPYKYGRFRADMHTQENLLWQILATLNGPHCLSIV
jgi:hypothetical protein